MAAPHVAGALAVLLSSGHTPESAVDRLLATATDLGAPGRDDSFGYGRIDLAKAVGPSVGGTTTPTTAVPGADSTLPPVTAATASSAPSTSVTSATGAPPPAVSTPETSAAAPFTPTTDRRDPPGWLVAMAVTALLASASGVGAARLAPLLTRPTRR
jgi:serine protease